MRLDFIRKEETRVYFVFPAFPGQSEVECESVPAKAGSSRREGKGRTGEPVPLTPFGFKILFSLPSSAALKWRECVC